MATQEHKMEQVPHEDLVKEHKEQVSGVQRLLKEAVVKAGRATDDDLREIDGVFVGTFVLPSDKHIYVGYGAMGGLSAYRGPLDDLKPDEVAQKLLEYADSQAKSSA